MIKISQTIAPKFKTYSLTALPVGLEAATEEEDPAGPDVAAASLDTPAVTVTGTYSSELQVVEVTMPVVSPGTLTVAEPTHAA